MSGLVVFVVFCARETQKVQRDRAIQLSIGIANFYDDDDELRHTEAKDVIDKNSWLQIVWNTAILFFV